MSIIYTYITINSSASSNYDFSKQTPRHDLFYAAYHRRQLLKTSLGAHLSLSFPLPYFSFPFFLCPPLFLTFFTSTFSSGHGEGSGEHLSCSSGSGRSSTDKRFWCVFSWKKSASGESNFIEFHEIIASAHKTQAFR